MKKIKNVQYCRDTIIVDYGDGQIFEFCDTCCDGHHFQAFLHHFCPKMKFWPIEKKRMARLERRFYLNLVRSAEVNML